jgi:hypothetical protein
MKFDYIKRHITLTMIRSQLLFPMSKFYQNIADNIIYDHTLNHPMLIIFLYHLNEDMSKITSSLHVKTNAKENVRQTLTSIFFAHMSMSFNFVCGPML